MCVRRGIPPATLDLFLNLIGTGVLCVRRGIPCPRRSRCLGVVAVAVVVVVATDVNDNSRNDSTDVVGISCGLVLSVETVTVVVSVAFGVSNGMSRNRAKRASSKISSARDAVENMSCPFMETDSRLTSASSLNASSFIVEISSLE